MVEDKQYLRFSSAASMLPKEETLETATKNNLTIGIPREQSKNENRIGLVPEAIKPLVDLGHRILVETSAGLKADFTDYEYAEAGAEITNERASVFGADIVLKIAPPYPTRSKCFRRTARLCPQFRHLRATRSISKT